MNGDEFSPQLQKGIWADGCHICTSSFYSEGNGTDLDMYISPECREITCLADYFALLKELHDEKEQQITEEKGDDNSGFLFLYRGQKNINWAHIPPMAREKKALEKEHLIVKEYHRQFFELFDNCRTMMEEEVIMQHNGSLGRCMDLLMHPLIALWAACQKEEDKEKEDMPGEVSFWCLDNDNDDLKAYDSSTVAILANTAKMEYNFSMGNIQIDYHREHPTELEDFIYIKDILRRAVIVRPKFNNQRIRNQQTCFAIVNLNQLVDDTGDFESKFGVSADEFTHYILNAEVINAGESEELKYPNIRRLKEGKHTLSGADFSDLMPWDLNFRKLTPREAPYVDSFDLYRYMYSKPTSSQNERIPVYAVILPECKDSIINELKYLNINKAYLFPEMENIGREIKETFRLKV